MIETMRVRVVVMVLVLMASASGFGQTAKKPAFEVASVRLTASGTPTSIKVAETRVDISNYPLRSLMLMAFKVELFQLSAPDWTRDPRVDIHATLPAGATREQVPDMLQTLLAERFGLVTHIEPRRVEAYELVVGKSGIKMREVEPVDELSKVFPTDPSLQGRGTDITSDTPEGPVRRILIPLGGRTVTGRSLYDTWTTANRTFQVDATRITMAQFAQILAYNVDRPVIDKTGLTGVYEFKVELDVNASAVRGLRSSGITTTVTGTPVDEPTGVSTFKAVEGLGLKLEDRRSPFDIIVVDKVERTPTEN